MRDASTARVRALVLSRAHHCLLVRTVDGLCVPEHTGPWPSRPLEALRRHVHTTTGLTLPSPAGSVVPADGRGPRDFVFLLDAPAAPATGALTWAPLPRTLELTAPAGHDTWIWSMYVDCMLSGWEPPARDIDVFFFGDGPEMASKLAHLVTCGKKRGTAGWLRGARLDGSTVPRPGLVSIVTDGFGFPRCAIQTDAVRTLRFGDVDETIAALEGEGDLTLADWREGHLEFFRSEAESLNLSFDDDEEVFVERFRVLRIFGRDDEQPAG